MLLPTLMALALSSDTQLQACPKISDPLQRLDCYDQLAGPSSSAPTTRVEPEPEGFRLQASTEMSLHVRCREQLTYLWLELHPALSASEALLLDGQMVGDAWFVRQQGQRLEAGRGLPAIQLLLDWIQHSQLETSKGRHLSLRQLASALRPIRARCHW